MLLIKNAQNEIWQPIFSMLTKVEQKHLQNLFKKVSNRFLNQFTRLRNLLFRSKKDGTGSEKIGSEKKSVLDQIWLTLNSFFKLKLIKCIFKYIANLF